MKTKKTTFGLIVGNRGFFPGHLAEEGRAEMLAALAGAGYGSVALSTKDTAFGAVESYEDAKKCAALFKKHADEIDGIIVSLPNFGDERGVADTLKLAGLDVPVLVQATPDDPKKMTIANRRDSFCGKMSVCNNLKQYGIQFSLTDQHTVAPSAESFQADLDVFASCCRVVRGLRNARIGAIGARPAAFNTVRYSEKILQANGITIETIDLYEMLGRATKLDAKAAPVKAKLAAIKAYIDTKGVPPAALLKMAQMGTAIDTWIAERELDATAIQCWTAMEEFFGVVPCTIMSMLSENLLPSACEVDIGGAIGMLAMRLAGGRPSALLDWNNNIGDDPDLCMLFHCSNLPKSCFGSCKMDYQAIIAGAVGKQNSWGTCTGRIAAGPFTYCRVATEDTEGFIKAYVGEGEFLDTPKLNTFGGYGVARINMLQSLLEYICANGFEHHVAVNPCQCSMGVTEAMGNYLGWDVYYHE